MTVSSLARLYPAAWRARYGAEFESLLADRPLTIRDSLDIVRGALDARLHPQVAGEADAPRVATAFDRVAAWLLIVGGLLLAGWAAILVAVGPRWDAPFTIEPWIVNIGMTVGLLGTFLACAGLLAAANRHATELSEIGVAGAIMTALGLVFSALGGALLGLLMLVGGSAVFIWRAGGRICSRRIALVLGVATVLSAVGQLGFVGSGGQDTRFLWLLTAYGPAWTLLGIGLRPPAATPEPRAPFAAIASS